MKNYQWMCSNLPKIHENAPKMNNLSNFIIVFCCRHNQHIYMIVLMLRNIHQLLLDQFHDDFHTRSFSGLSFSMFQYCLYQTANFTIHIRMWSVNMIWWQIVEKLAIRWCSVERRTETCKKVLKSWIIQQFDIKWCLPITFEDEWWNLHFDTSNTETSKKVTLKTA